MLEKSDFCAKCLQKINANQHSKLFFSVYEYQTQLWIIFCGAVIREFTVATNTSQGMV